MSAREIRVLENHDEALKVWREAGARGQTVLHIDAHHDMLQAGDPGDEDIGNYLRYAIRDGIAGKIVWVVPDYFFQSFVGRNRLMHRVMDIVRNDPDGAINGVGSTIRFSIAGVEICVCTLARIPRLDGGSVLLDVDVDYFLRNSPGARTTLRLDTAPWVWPSDVTRAIREREIGFSVATIAFSVEGGFTPLAWRYLGNELGARLRGEVTHAFECQLRKLALKTLSRDDDYGRAPFQDSSLDDFPYWLRAAWYYAVALERWQQGDAAEAKKNFLAACHEDNAYASPWASKGILLQRFGRPKDAEKEFRMIVHFLPEDGRAWQLLGGAQLAIGSFAASERSLRKAISIDPSLAIAHRCLGECLYRVGRFHDAKKHLQLALALQISDKGSRWSWCSSPTRCYRVNVDFQHFLTYRMLGRVYANLGATEQAIASFSICLAARGDNVADRFATFALSHSLTDLGCLLKSVADLVNRWCQSITRAFEALLLLTLPGRSR